MQPIKTHARAGEAGFDFDVVTDLPLRPSRKPDPTPEIAPPPAGAAREKIAAAKA